MHYERKGHTPVKLTHLIDKISFHAQTTILIWIIVIGFFLSSGISLLSLQALKIEFDLSSPRDKNIQALTSLYHLYTTEEQDDQNLSKTLDIWNEYKTYTLTKNQNFLFNGFREWYAKTFISNFYEQIEILIPQENAFIDLIDQALLHDDHANVLTLLEKQLLISLSISLHQKKITDSLYSHTYTALMIFLGIIIMTILILTLSIRNSINTNHVLLERIVEFKTKQLQTLNTNLQKSIKHEVEQNRKKDLILYQQARLASMGEMIQNIAHQWRQPLNSLILLIQSFKTKGLQNKLDNDFVLQQTEYGMKIATEMSNTIENFRNFFRPENREEIFDVPQSIYHSLELLKGQLSVNNIQIQIKVSKEAQNLQIKGYQNSFTQVILVLINNAIDALKLKQEHLKTSPSLINISLKNIHGRMIMCVRDNAGGIDLKDKSRVFEPYFTTKHKSIGTGVGLYMAKQIIEQQMNGIISVQNTQWGSQNEYYGAEFKVQISNNSL